MPAMGRFWEVKGSTWQQRTFQWLSLGCHCVLWRAALPVGPVDLFLTLCPAVALKEAP